MAHLGLCTVIKVSKNDCELLSFPTTVVGLAGNELHEIQHLLSDKAKSWLSVLVAMIPNTSTAPSERLCSVCYTESPKNYSYANR